MKQSLKLLLYYIAIVIGTILLAEFVLPVKLGFFLLMSVIGGFPFWLFLIGMQALSEIK